MHPETLLQIAAELEALLTGKYLGRIFQLSPTSLAIDFHLKQYGLLFISVEPSAPRLHLLRRSLRELERKSIAPSPFVLALGAALVDTRIISITKDEAERVVRFHFSTAPENRHRPLTTMVAQLTGRSANLFLLDNEQTVVHALRRPMGEGQQVNDRYLPPPQSGGRISREQVIARGSFRTISEAADDYYKRIDAENGFQHAAGKLRDQLRREITKREKLRANLNKDLAGHGNADEHKRLGDLLLANISTARRNGEQVTLTDYYAEAQPDIQLTVDENLSLQDAAAAAFSRYGKAKRAAGEVKDRLQQIDRELAELTDKQRKLEAAIARGDETIFTTVDAGKEKTRARSKPKDKTIPGTRRYRSSDGYEVIVGRTARDNDNLTFRVARPNDLWLHAGDYPGSHVIVRNSSRREIPQRTMIEAAQLAAKFSQAGNDAKVIIHYTRRKFISKPKGAAPGLVRMSSFNTIAVEPAENIERIMD